ncbi:MAG: DUF3025 domain-containing protein [Deltaproteobacteria bacterium]|nr:DUF3025 domain-containing protein [Deltaproteobacteria bacterium]
MTRRARLEDPRYWPVRETLRECFRDLVDEPPSVASWNERLRSRALPVSFEAQPPRGRRQKNPSRSYYQRIVHERVVPSREANWHDFFNMLVWASFPRTKLRIHQLELELLEAHLDRPGRTHAEDTLSLLDEGGAVALVDPGAEGVREALAKEDVGALRVHVARGWLRVALIGHAVFEHLLGSDEQVFVMIAPVEGPIPPSLAAAVESIDRTLSAALGTTAFSLESKDYGRLGTEALSTL